MGGQSIVGPLSRNYGNTKQRAQKLSPDSIPSFPSFPTSIQSTFTKFTSHGLQKPLAKLLYKAHQVMSKLAKLASFFSVLLGLPRHNHSLPLTGINLLHFIMCQSVSSLFCDNCAKKSVFSESSC